MAGNRKDALRSLFAGGPMKPPEAEVADIAPPILADDGLTAVNAAGGEPVEPALPPRTASGAVKAMGLTLGAMTREAEATRQLRQALADGEHIAVLDPALVETSFVTDRISDGAGDDPDFQALVESIRQSGQQSPILVRPHGERPGFYETAYGHRRLKAVALLGLKVKAIVRPLSDDELVLAQGKENAERRNLSFIERALFAGALVQRGFERKLVGDALSVDKTELSRLLQVADAVPIRLARAIGPAPKAGRSRWMTLAGLLARESHRVIALDEALGARCQAEPSDARFAMVLARLQGHLRPEAEMAEELKDAAGRVVARIRRGRAPRIELTGRTDPGLLDDIVALITQRLKPGEG